MFVTFLAFFLLRWEGEHWCLKWDRELRSKFPCVEGVCSCMDVDGTHPSSNPCMGINVTSGLWQQSLFGLYFPLPVLPIHMSIRVIGYACEGPCCLFLSVRKSLVTFWSSKSEPNKPSLWISSEWLPEKNLSQIPPVEKLSPVCGLVGFESDLSWTAQLLLVASKPRGFTYELWAGREGGWSEGWMRLACSRRLQSQQLAPPGLYPVSARFTFP